MPDFGGKKKLGIYYNKLPLFSNCNVKFLPGC